MKFQVNSRKGRERQRVSQESVLESGQSPAGQ